MGIKNILRKIRIRPNCMEPICDSNIYEGNMRGYAGGSLQDQNVLIVTNSTVDEKLTKMVISEEKCHLKVLFIDEKKMTKRHIMECEKDLMGSFTHIINIVVANNHVNIEPHSLVYQWMQIETDYLIGNEQYATICTALIEKNESSEEIKAELFAASNMIHGLGLVMANHNIIVNGIYADSNVNLTNILNAALFMNSKYGQIMAGEILELKG